MSLSYTFHSLCILEMYLTHVFLANCLGQKFDGVAGATFIQSTKHRCQNFDAVDGATFLLKYRGQT